MDIIQAWFHFQLVAVLLFVGWLIVSRGDPKCTGLRLLCRTYAVSMYITAAACLLSVWGLL
jgi:hypothetical protein